MAMTFFVFWALENKQISETHQIRSAKMAAQFSCAMMRCLCLMFVLFSFIDGKFITPLEKCKLGVVQTVVWEPETRDETSDAKGDKGSVVELLQQLKAMDWECPVKVKGKTLATTLVNILLVYHELLLFYSDPEHTIHTNSFRFCLQTRFSEHILYMLYIHVLLHYTSSLFENGHHCHT